MAKFNHVAFTTLSIGEKFREGNRVYQKTGIDCFARVTSKGLSQDSFPQVNMVVVPCTQEWLDGRARQRKNQNLNQAARDGVMRDCGLVKCKDSAGRTIWE